MTVWSDQRAAAKSGRLRGFHGESNDHKLRTLLSFLVPTLCDAFATTLLNIGLFYTCAAASPACAQASSRGGCPWMSLAAPVATVHASCVGPNACWPQMPACEFQPHAPQELPPHLGLSMVGATNAECLGVSLCHLIPGTSGACMQKRSRTLGRGPRQNWRS